MTQSLKWESEPQSSTVPAPAVPLGRATPAPPFKGDPFSLSSFGAKLTARSGILELMDDLGRAMTLDRNIRMLGGGNPAAVPANVCA